MDSPCGRRDRGGRLLGPLERGRHHDGHVARGQVVADHLGHLPAELGEVEVGQAAVQHALGVVDLTVAQQVHHRGVGGTNRAHDPSVANESVTARAAAGRALMTRSTARVVVAGADEPRLERARRQVHALAQHRVEERRERLRVLGFRVVVVADLTVAEEDREHAAGPLDDVRHAGPAQLLGDRRGDGLADHVEPVVDLRGAPAQRREARRGGHRVTGEGARLVDRPERREHRHDVGAAAERRGREPAAHDLAEGEQVGRTLVVRALQAVPAGGAAPEAGHHLIGDQQRAVRAGRPGAGPR